MKRVIVLFATMFCCSLAFCQEADATKKSSIEFSVIPRLDLNTFIPMQGDGQGGSGLGNSSLYTLLEGSFAGHFSYSVCTQFLSDDPVSLYANTWYSDGCSWLNWANFTWQPCSFGITVGKEAIAMGSWEFDFYDFETHFDQNSIFWTNLPCYEWGGKVFYATEDESTVLKLQFCASPFAERPFQNGMYSLSFCWTGEYGVFQPKWSVNMMKSDIEGPDRYVYYLALGNKFQFERLSFFVDWSCHTRSISEFFKQEMTFVGDINYYFNDTFQLGLRGGYEYSHGEPIIIGSYPPIDYWNILPSGILKEKDYCYGGLYFHTYLLEEKNLRLHLAASANNYSNNCSLLIGVLYSFSISR